MPLSQWNCTTTNVKAKAYYLDEDRLAVLSRSYAQCMQTHADAYSLLTFIKFRNIIGFLRNMVWVPHNRKPLDKGKLIPYQQQ
jgi:hypothetical protein